MTYIHNHIVIWTSYIFAFWTLCGYIGRGLIRGARLKSISQYAKRYANRAYPEWKLRNKKATDDLMSLRREKLIFLQGPIGLGRLLYEAYDWGCFSQFRFSLARNTDSRDAALENWDVVALLIWVCLLANPHPVFALGLMILLWSKMAPMFSACGNLATPRLAKLRYTNWWTN